MSYLPPTLICPKCSNQPGLTGRVICIWRRPKPPHELCVCRNCKWIWNEIKAYKTAMKKMPNIAILRRSSFSPEQWGEWRKPTFASGGEV